MLNVVGERRQHERPPAAVAPLVASRHRNITQTQTLAASGAMPQKPSVSPRRCPRAGAPSRSRRGSPRLAEDAVGRGHEVAAHGYRWEPRARMRESEERAVIARAVRAITAAAGTRPVGRHTRSTPSPNTRRLSSTTRTPTATTCRLSSRWPAFAISSFRTASTRTTCISTGARSASLPPAISPSTSLTLRYAVAGRGVDALDAVDRPAPQDDRPARPHCRARARAAAHAGQGRRVVRAARRDRAPLDRAVRRAPMTPRRA